MTAVDAIVDAGTQVAEALRYSFTAAERRY
jgi:hypothetical protein